jgi:hypothetical protein
MTFPEILNRDRAREETVKSREDIKMFFSDIKEFTSRIEGRNTLMKC